MSTSRKSMITQSCFVAYVATLPYKYYVLIFFNKTASTASVLQLQCECVSVSSASTVRAVRPSHLKLLSCQDGRPYIISTEPRETSGAWVVNPGQSSSSSTLCLSQEAESVSLTHSCYIPSAEQNRRRMGFKLVFFHAGEIFLFLVKNHACVCERVHRNTGSESHLSPVLRVIGLNNEAYFKACYSSWSSPSVN